MDAVASLPPYAHVTQEAVQCAAQASLRYGVPELLLHAILKKEDGRLGSAVKNSNGSQDLGPAQINSVWLKDFGRYGLRAEHLRDNFCINLYASAYILRDNYNKKDGDWFKAIVAYNIGPNKWTPERYSIGYRYAVDVVNHWWGFQNWVDARQGIQRQGAPSFPEEVVSLQPQKSRSPQLVFDLANE